MQAVELAEKDKHQLMLQVKLVKIYWLRLHIVQKNVDSNISEKNPHQNLQDRVYKTI